MLTNFHNIWQTLYSVNLQHNSYWFAYLTYILLLHYPANVGYKNYNFTKQVTLFVVQTNKTSSLSTQPVCTTQNITASVQSVFLFHSHRLEVSWAIHQQHHPQWFAISHSKCQSSAISDRPLPKLVSERDQNLHKYLAYFVTCRLMLKYKMHPMCISLK